MKTTKYLTTLLLGMGLSVLLCGCDDFLDKQPETDLAPGSFFNTANDLELWTNSFYTEITSPDVAGKQIDDTHICDDLTAVQLGSRSPENESWTTSTWSLLRNIHYYFENSTNCTDESVRSKYNGVAYFFRAMFYFEKVRKYGDMPYYDHLISDSDKEALYKPRDPRGYVMQKVMEDFDRAIEMLPDAWASEPLYHVSKNAARAMKSRAALYEGTFRKYHNIADETYKDENGTITLSAEYFLKQAADAAQAVMATGKYKLYTGNTFKLNAPYREYFILEDGDAKETILSMRFNMDITVRHDLQFAYRTHKHSFTRAFIDHYLMADGTKVQDQPNYDKMEYCQQFQNRDPRMAQSVAGPGYKQLGSTDEVIESFTEDLTGYSIIKFVSNSDHDGASKSTSDWPILRYPEVLLNYAEAKAELGTITADDIQQTIDVIRARVSMPALDMAAANANPDAFLSSYYPHAQGGANKGVLLEIRRERTVELACEGFRLWDMLRWKEGKQLTRATNTTGGFMGLYFPGLGEYDMNGDGVNDIVLYQGTKPTTTLEAIEVGTGKKITLSNGTSGYVTCFSTTYTWDENRDYLWPIPAEQRKATQGALSQNPGYSDGLDQ